MCLILTPFNQATNSVIPNVNPQFLPYPNFSLTHILFPMVTNQFPQLKIPSNHSHL